RFSRDWSSDVCSSDLGVVQEDRMFDQAGIAYIDVQAYQALGQEGPTVKADRRFPGCPEKNDRGQKKSLNHPKQHDMGGEIVPDGNPVQKGCQGLHYIK